MSTLRSAVDFVPRIAVATLAIAWIVGCEWQKPREPTEADRQARSQQLIEYGNQAFEAGDYRLAARRYAAAAVVKKDDPAAYFGMGMALTKLGRDEEARAAYARARELARLQRAKPAALKN